MNSLLKVPARFQVNQVLTILHPKFGRKKAKVINSLYQALTGDTVVLSVEDHDGLMYINEKFLAKIVGA